ncbi:hypothetical protein HWI77_19260 (plasmid) [Acinetobacter venetianus]|nr:hypothetical protein PSNIH1_19285 [Pantoea sp. PSNIH1]QNH53346.1 hypothetical protein HWI77_19260 [Acinetobacter venetianus]
MEIRIKCPHCGSGSVKKSRAVYEQGTSKTRSVSHTGWISNRGSGGSRRQGKSTRQSVAASRNAPAGRKLEGIVFTGAFFLFTWLALCVQGTTLQSSLAAGAALSIVVTVLVAYLNRHNRRRALEDYERQWYCSKCGDTFLRDHGAGA